MPEPTDTTNQTPDQPDGIEDDSFDLPDPVRAAERVGDFLSAYGDGLIEALVAPEFEGAMPPLYARDLEALRKLADQAGTGDTAQPGDGDPEAWRQNRAQGWFRDVGYALQKVLGEHRYLDVQRGSKQDDPGWHPCTCGWEGYWSAFHPHVADHLRMSVAAAGLLAAHPDTRPLGHWCCRAGLEASPQPCPHHGTDTDSPAAKLANVIGQIRDAVLQGGQNEASRAQKVRLILDGAGFLVGRQEPGQGNGDTEGDQ